MRIDICIPSRKSYAILPKFISRQSTIILHPSTFGHGQPVIMKSIAHTII
uniref:Uncharacterized protein n=1 Tax=Onchocerca volvulus TaxID=6282 RepID=A0A8R1TL34_ONCVO